MQLEIPILLSPEAVLPQYRTLGSAGMDLCTTEDFELLPSERKLVPTGVRLAIPPGFEGQVRARSGLALRHGIAMVNAPGTIDSDYRGEIGLILINLGQDPVKLSAGERVAQLVICPVVTATLKVVENLDETDRGNGGFGSTGTLTTK